MIEEERNRFYIGDRIMLANQFQISVNNRYQNILDFIDIFITSNNYEQNCCDEPFQEQQNKYQSLAKFYHYLTYSGYNTKFHGFTQKITMIIQRIQKQQLQFEQILQFKKEIIEFLQTPCLHSSFQNIMGLKETDLIFKESQNSVYQFGSNSSCDVVIKHQSISNFHAYIYCEKNAFNNDNLWYISDGKCNYEGRSRNGTWKILQPNKQYKIYNNDHLCVGDYEINLQIEEECA